MTSCNAEELQREQFAALVRLMPTMYRQMIVFATSFGLFLYVVNESLLLIAVFVPVLGVAVVRGAHWRRLQREGYDLAPADIEAALRKTTQLGVVLYISYSLFAIAATWSSEASLVSLAMMIVWGSAIGVSFYLSVLPHAAIGIVGTSAGSVAVAFLASHDLRMIASIPIVLVVSHAAIGLHRAAFENFRQLVLSHAKVVEMRGEALEMAMTDMLTGLPNRRALDARLAAMQAKRAAFSVAMIDLDGFKPVNDVNGHAAGDACLREAARRLREGLAEDVFVARMGGDEFALLSLHVGAAFLTIAEAAVRRIAGDYEVEGGRVVLGASCGVAISEAGGPAPRLLERADIALYRAKAQTRGGVVLFCEALEDEARHRVLLERAMHDAIDQDAFDVRFQPIASLRTRDIVGFEALARWAHPKFGPVRPDVFIPLAEQSGLIEAISDQLLRKAAAHAARWPAHVALAFNLSARQIGRPGVERDIFLALQRSGLSPRQLVIEITETAIMADCVAAAHVVSALKRLGMRVALDDFGSGYSSFGQLADLSIDKLKIDRAFVQRIEDDEKSRSIVRAIIGMCADLGVVCLAEGVETDAQFRLLREWGCDLAQGYLIGKPMTAAQAQACIDAGDSVRLSA